MKPDPKREAELHVRESEIAEQALRARLTDDSALLADARQQLAAIEQELTGLRAARLGDGIDRAIAAAAGTEAIEGVDAVATEPAQDRRRVIGSVADRLLQRVREVVEGAGDIVGAQLQPATVLGSGDTELRHADSASSPATLELAAGASSVLGDHVQTRVVVGDGQIRIWLSGVSSTLAGATLVAAALTEVGDLAQARAVVRPDGTPIQLELSWAGHRPPEQIVLAVQDP